MQENIKNTLQEELKESVEQAQQNISENSIENQNSSKTQEENKSQSEQNTSQNAVNETIENQNVTDENATQTTTETSAIELEYLQKIQALEAELATTKDQLLRLAADFDNFKKRTLKEKSELVLYANEELIKGILPILDDFERTMKVVHTSDNLEAIKQGLELVSKNLYHHLNKKGLELIPSLNEEFNSDLHEAIGSLPAEENQKNKVIDVIEQGYKFQGKVVRHSKVIIGV